MKKLLSAGKKALSLGRIVSLEGREATRWRWLDGWHLDLMGISLMNSVSCGGRGEPGGMRFMESTRVELTKHGWSWNYELQKKSCVTEAFRTLKLDILLLLCCLLSCFSRVRLILSHRPLQAPTSLGINVRTYSNTPYIVHHGPKGASRMWKWFEHIKKTNKRKI